jgi:hypothetical protein
MPFRAPVNSSFADGKCSEAAFIPIDVELDISMPDFDGSPHNVLWNVESDFVLTHRKEILDSGTPYCPSASKKRSASMAAMQPAPAAVMACR